jgi:hypothetical protein
VQLYEDETLEIAELKHRIQQLDDQYDAFQQKQADLEGRISQTVISEMQAEQIKAYCLAARDGIDHFTFEDKRMVIERLDVRGYIERGETTKDYRITITGFFPPTEVSSEHDATLCVCEDEGFRHVTEDNMSRFCGLRPVDHHAG